MHLRDLIPVLLLPLAFTLNAQDPVVTDDPKAAGDGSWVAISGKVKDTSHEQFTLAYDEGTINVQVEREDLEGHEHEFLVGEQVTVVGLVDEGFLRSTRIQARAVYVESLSTYVYRTDGTAAMLEVFTPVMTSGLAVHGRVKSISGTNIVLDEGDRSITIDTSAISEDTAEGNGIEQVSEGDMITAVGSSGRQLFAGRTLKATSLYKLAPGGEMPMDAGREIDREY